MRTGPHHVLVLLITAQVAISFARLCLAMQQIADESYWSTNVLQLGASLQTPTLNHTIGTSVGTGRPNVTMILQTCRLLLKESQAPIGLARQPVSCDIGCIRCSPSQGQHREPQT